MRLIKPFVFYAEIAVRQLETLLYLDFFECLKHIVGQDVVVASDAKTTFETVCNFLHVVLETLE